MTTRQSNILAMGRAVHGLTNGAPETRAIPGLPIRINTLGAILASILAQHAQQAQPVAVPISSRNRVTDGLIESTLVLAGAVLSHAVANGLDGLARAVRVTRADFTRARVDQRIELAQHIINAIRPELPRLADMGVTVAMVDEIQDQINAARATLTGPRTAVAIKRAATEQMAAQFRELTSLLEDQIDPLVYRLRVENPEFYARYRAVREIIDRPGVRRTTDEGDETPAQPTAPDQKAA